MSISQVPKFIPKAFQPLPPGTKIKPWVPGLIFTPISRAFERLGVYFYNRVISNTEIGLYHKLYNPKVHGPYCHYRWYGKQDTKLMDVKMSDLPAWFARRDKSIGAIYNEIMRNAHLIHHKWYCSEFGSPIRSLFRLMYIFTFFCWFITMPVHWDLRRAFYHW